MKLRYVVSLAVLLVLVLTFTVFSSDESPTYGGTLIYGTSVKPPTLDWHSTNATATREIGFHVFEGLVTYSKSMEVIPQLASSWDIEEDGTRYVFHLRDVNFHNGRELTADDVVASFERFMEVSPRSADLSELIVEMCVIDEKTIAFELASPARFLNVLANPAPAPVILPRECIDGKGPGELAVEDLVGTGPFKLVEHIPNERIVLERFEGYKPNDFPATGFGGKRVAYLDKVIFRQTPEAASRLAGLKIGEFDVVDGLPISSIRDLQKADDLQAVPMPPGYTIDIVFNKSKAPFNNVLLRQAVQLAIDREAIMETVSQGNLDFVQMNPEWFPEGHKWYMNIAKPLGLYRQDIEKARELLEQANYQGEVVRILTNTDYDYMYKTAVVLHANLEQAGFNSQLIVLDWAGTQARNKDKDGWEIYFSGSSLRFDASDYYYKLWSKNQWVGWIDNPRIDSLIVQDQETLDETVRRGIWEEIFTIVHQDVTPYLVPGHIYMLQGANKAVKGYEPFVLSQFWNVWLGD